MKKLFKYQTDSGDNQSPEEWVDECYLGTHTPLTGTRKRFHQILTGDVNDEWGTGWSGTSPSLDPNVNADVDTFIGEVSKYYNYYVEEFDYRGEHHPNPWDIAWTPLIKGQLVRYTADITAASRDYDANDWSADSTNLSLGETASTAAEPIAIFTSSNRHFFCDGMRVNMRNFDGDFAYLQQDDQANECVYYVKALTAYTFALFQDEALTIPVQILKLPRDQYEYNFRFTQPDEPVIIRFNNATYKDGTDYDFLTNGTSALCRWEDFDAPDAIAVIPPQRDYWIDKAREGNPDTLDANEYYLHKVNPTLHTPLVPTDLIEPAVGYAYTKYFSSWQDRTDKYGASLPKYALFWDRGDAFTSDFNIRLNDENRNHTTVWTEELFDPATAVEYNNRFTLWTSKTKSNISDNQTSEILSAPEGELFITSDSTANADMLVGDYAYGVSIDEASEVFTSDITFTNKLLNGSRKDQHFFATTADWNEDDSSPEIGGFYGGNEAEMVSNKIYSIGERGFPVLGMNYAPHEDLVIFLHDNDIDRLFRFTDTPVVELALPWPEVAYYAYRGDNGDFLDDYSGVPYYYAERVDQSWYGQTRYGDLKQQDRHYDSGVATKHTAIKLYKDSNKTEPLTCDINYVPMSIALPVQNIWLDPNNQLDLWVELHTAGMPAPHITGDPTRRQQSVDEFWTWPEADEYGTLLDDSTGGLPQELRLFQGSMVSFAGLEDVDWEDGNGFFSDGSTFSEESWTADGGGWKWSRLNGKKFRAGKNTTELGENVPGGYEWYYVEGEDELGNPITRTMVKIEHGQQMFESGKGWKDLIYDQGGYPYNPLQSVSSLNKKPVEMIQVNDGGVPGTETVDIEVPGELTTFTTQELQHNHLFYNLTELHNDQNADDTTGLPLPGDWTSTLDSTAEPAVRATNADGSLKNIGAYMLVEWGYFTTDPANVVPPEDLEPPTDNTAKPYAGFSNYLTDTETEDDIEFLPLENLWGASVPRTTVLADDNTEFHDHKLYRITVADEPGTAPEAAFSRGCGIHFNHFGRDTNDNGAGVSGQGWDYYNPYPTTFFHATSVEYFPHAFTYEDVELDIFDEDAAEATTGLVRATDDTENPVRLDLENLQVLVPGNKTFRYIDWNTAANDTDWTYPSSVAAINGHWWEPGSTTEDTVMRDPITQSRIRYHNSGLGDTHNGWGHEVYPYTDTGTFNPAPPTGPTETPWAFDFELSGSSQLTGNISGDLDTFDCSNVGRFQAHREGQEVLIETLTPTNVGEEPGPTNAEKITAEETWDYATEWLDTDDNPSEERYWPRSEEGKCMTPRSAKIIIDQPASTSISQSGMKYVRSAGYTQWRLELRYPPMLQEEWEPFNAAIHKARGEKRSFRLSLRHYEGFNWLFGTQGYFENRRHHQGAGYDKQYYENVRHYNFENDTIGSLKHTRYVQVLEDVMPGDDVIKTAGWPSHTTTLPEGSLVGGLGGRNGGVNTIVSNNQSNIWGECEFRVAYPLQATYQSGYDMNTPILQKGSYWYPEPDWLRVSLDEDSIDFDVSLISRFGFTIKFRLDDVR